VSELHVISLIITAMRERRYTSIPSISRG